MDSGHPLELHDDVAWETYRPVSKLSEHIGEQVVSSPTWVNMNSNPHSPIAEAAQAADSRCSIQFVVQ